jgi:hypothetical protein
LEDEAEDGEKRKRRRRQHEMGMRNREREEEGRREWYFFCESGKGDKRLGLVLGAWRWVKERDSLAFTEVPIFSLDPPFLLSVLVLTRF